jgi:uncharacterized membrane protein YecN with MAPEG domain
MTTMPLPVISATTAGILLILQMLLMLRTALTRRVSGPSLGEGHDATLLRRSRRHGNLAENAAIFIAGFTLLELLGERPLWLEGACAVFLVARLLHIIGLSRENTANIFRVLGVILTFAIGVSVGVRLVLLGWPHLTL